MKYAKKLKVIPYVSETSVLPQVSSETLAMSQIGSLLNNALKFEKIPDEKLKIYNQALAKLKE